MTTTVHVSNILQSIEKERIHEFFSFCGKITEISVTPASSAPDATQSATITFERDTAAKTALMLDGSQLDGSEIKVSLAESLDGLATEAEIHAHQEDELLQEDKPRSAILAEYLAHGYLIGDRAIEKGIELDKKHGITTRFTNYLTQINSRIHATDRAVAADNTYKISDRANQGLNTIQRYFETSLSTPTGQKVRDFYTQVHKQAMDIHNEAQRLKELKKKEAYDEAVKRGEVKQPVDVSGSEAADPYAPPPAQKYA